MVLKKGTCFSVSPSKAQRSSSEILNSLRTTDIGYVFNVGIEIEIRGWLDYDGGVRNLEQFLSRACKE